MKEPIPAGVVLAEFEGEGIDSAEAQQRADHYRDVGFCVSERARLAL